MIIFKCDKCKKEFKPDKLFFEGKIGEKKSFMIPIKGKEPLIGEQPIVKIFHLCPSCTLKFQQEFLT